MYKLAEGVDYSYKAGVPGLYNEKGELVKKAEDMSAQELSTYESDYRRRRGEAQIKVDQQVNAILKAEQEAKRKAAAEAKAKAEAEAKAKAEAEAEAEAKPEAAKPEAAKPEAAKPKPAGQKLVWNKQRMDFDTPDGKPAPYPKVEPRDIDIRGLSAYRPGGALPRLSSTGVSASSSPTPTPTATAPAAPKPEGVSAGLKKWASIYGPGGPKELKQPTPSQRRLFKYTHPSTEKSVTEAYDVVLDYLLSEGHADTVEEAHYVMMQLDSEYIQSIVEDSAPIPNIPTPTEKPKDKKKPPADTKIPDGSGYGPEEGGVFDREVRVPPNSYGDLRFPPNQRFNRGLGGPPPNTNTRPNTDPTTNTKPKPRKPLISLYPGQKGDGLMGPYIQFGNTRLGIPNISPFRPDK